MFTEHAITRTQPQISSFTLLHTLICFRFFEAACPSPPGRISKHIRLDGLVLRLQPFHAVGANLSTSAGGRPTGSAFEQVALRAGFVECSKGGTGRRCSGWASEPCHLPVAAPMWHEMQPSWRSRIRRAFCTMVRHSDSCAEGVLNFSSSGLGLSLDLRACR
jgi:hypothetical protein